MVKLQLSHSDFQVEVKLGVMEYQGKSYQLDLVRVR